MRPNAFVEPLGIPHYSWVRKGDMLLPTGEPDALDCAKADPHAAWELIGQDSENTQWQPNGHHLQLSSWAIKSITIAPWGYDAVLREQATQQVLGSGDTLPPNPRV